MSGGLLPIGPGDAAVILIAPHGRLPLHVGQALSVGSSYIEMDDETLRAIDHERLTLGEPLRGALRNERGQVLLNTGRILDRDGLVRVLKSVGPLRTIYIGADWPQDDADRLSPPAPAIEDADSQRPANGVVTAAHPGSDGADKRRHPRREWKVAITVHVQRPSGDVKESRPLEVITHDLSEGGFSFVTRRSIPVAARLSVQFVALPERGRLVGTVRHCKVMGNGDHLVGVQFVTGDDPVR